MPMRKASRAKVKWNAGVHLVEQLTLRMNTGGHVVNLCIGYRCELFCAMAEHTPGLSDGALSPVYPEASIRHDSPAQRET